MWVRAKRSHARYATPVEDPLTHGRRASAIGMALNGGLAVIKLVTGIAGHSNALVADAVESLGDICGSAVVWGGLVIASKPADENHPYGHGKAEPLAALAVALMLVGAAVAIAFQAIHAMRTEHPSPAMYTLPVILVIIVIKEAMYRFERRAAHRSGSLAVSVDAWHHRSDALTSGAAAVGIAIALIGGPGYETADDWAALVACLVIVANAVHFVRGSVKELMDTSPDTALLEAIEAVSLGTEGAKFVEKVLVRKVGPSLYVDLHLEVDPQLPVASAHRIAHGVKDAIRNRWPQVADVLVHVEPYGSRT